MNAIGKDVIPAKRQTKVTKQGGRTIRHISNQSGRFFVAIRMAMRCKEKLGSWPTEMRKATLLEARERDRQKFEQMRMQLKH